MSRSPSTLLLLTWFSNAASSDRKSSHTVFFFYFGSCIPIPDMECIPRTKASLWGGEEGGVAVFDL